MVEETSTIESTKALLEMVEPGDHETREELENTLRVIEDMHEVSRFIGDALFEELVNLLGIFCRKP